MKPDVYEDLADAVLAIQSDADLKRCFNQILTLGSSTQQVRVASLILELDRMGAPENLKNFVRLLSNDQLANLVLQQINSD